MRVIKASLLFALLFLLTTCSDDESGPKWEKLTSFPGAARFFAPAVHNSNAYLFFGQRNFNTYSNTAWKYTSEEGEWTELSSFDGVGRCKSTAFTVGNSIYIVGGEIIADDPDDFDGVTITDEVVKYDITTDSWEQLSPFPGGPTSEGMAFQVDGEIFYGFGSYQNRTFWKYNPSTDEWIPRTDFPGALSFGGEGKYSVLYSRIINFVYNTKIFVVTGASYDQPEMWEYDTNTNEWTELTDLTFGNKPAQETYLAMAGTISYLHKNKCYYLLGVHSSDWPVTNTATQGFDPETHEWKLIDEAAPYAGAGAFLINTGTEIILGSDFSSDYDDHAYQLWKRKL